MRRHANSVLAVWISVTLAVLLLTGSATREGADLRTYVAFLACIILIPVLLNPRVWDRLRQSRVIGAGLIAIIIIAILQLLPLGFIPDTLATENIRAEAEFLDRAESRRLTLDPVATRTMLGLCILLLAIWMAAALMDKRGGKLLHWIVIGLALFSLFLGLAQRAGQFGGHLLWDNFNAGVLVGPFANSNHMATLLAIGIGYSMMGFVRSRYKLSGLRGQSRAAGYLGLTVLLFFGLILSDSSAGIAIAVTLVILSLLIGFRWKSNLLARSTSIGLFGIGLGIPLIFILLSFTGSLPEPQGALGTANYLDRHEIWAIAGNMAREHWLFGVGFGAFDNVFPLYEDHMMLARRFANEAHSDILQIVMEGGLILFAVYAIVLFRSARVVEEQLRRRDLRLSYRAPALLGCLAVFAHSLVDYPAQTWFIAGLLVAMMTVTFGSNFVSRTHMKNFKADVVHL